MVYDKTPVFRQPPDIAAPSYLWMRYTGSDYYAGANSTTIAVYDKSVSNLQYFYGANFTAEAQTGSSTSFMIGPPVPQGLFLKTSNTFKPLTVGMVRQANTPFSITTDGYLNASGCGSNGAYVVHEVSYSPAGSLLTLAVDFSNACNATGALRYKSSVPTKIDQTYIVPGVDHAVTEGYSVILDGRLSWNPSSRLKNLSWTQLSGPAFDLTDCKLGRCNSYAPLVPAGGATAVFRLSGESELGKSASADLKITIRSWRDTQSRVDIYGAGYVSFGSDLHFTELDGPFEVPVKSGTEAVYLDQTPERIRFLYYGNDTYRSSHLGAPELVLSNSIGRPLVPGLYSGTTRNNFIPAQVPSFDFSFGGHGCGQPIWKAAVAALDRNPADLTQVSRAAIWFQDQCGEGGSENNASYGRFWINYTPQLPPTAVATGPQSAVAGQTFTLKDGGSQSPAGSVLATAWRQVFGTRATSFTLQADGSVQVVAPSTTPVGSTLVFSYEVVDSLGQAGITLVKVLIAAP